MTPDRAAVLDAMSGDLDPWAWSVALDCSPVDVQSYCRERELPLAASVRWEAAEELREARATIAALRAVLDDVMPLH